MIDWGLIITGGIYILAVLIGIFVLRPIYKKWLNKPEEEEEPTKEH